jgi:hypothetical protein
MKKVGLGKSSKKIKNGHHTNTKLNTGKRRGRPPNKHPRNKDARKINEHDEYYKPPEVTPPIKDSKFIGFCCKDGAMIVSGDKEGRKFRCMGCGKLRAKADLCKTRQARNTDGRRDKDDEVVDTQQDLHPPVTRTYAGKKPVVDDDDLHTKMIK